MKLLPALTEEAAHALERRAFAFCRAEGNKGGRWSEILTDGTQFAIGWDDSIAAAFTPAEIASVIEGDLVQRDSEGTITGGTWAEYVPPAPPEEEIAP